MRVLRPKFELERSSTAWRGFRGSRSTRAAQMVLGTTNTEVTVPNLAGEGTVIVEANSDGTLKRSSISTNDIINNFNRVDGNITNLQDDLRSSSKGLVVSKAKSKVNLTYKEVEVRVLMKN